MHSIKVKIIAAILFCVMLANGIVGEISIQHSGKVAEEDAQKTMTLCSEKQLTELNACITSIEQSVNMLADLCTVQLDYSKFENNEKYIKEYTDSIFDLVETVSTDTNGAIAAYVRYNPEIAPPTSGIFLTRNSTEESFQSMEPTDFSIYDKDDTEHVGWYYIPVEKGEATWMDPYYNENIGIYMISYVVPVFHEGKSVGVIGMDIDFTELQNLTSDVSIYADASATLLNTEGVVLSDKKIEAGTQFSSLSSSAQSLLEEMKSQGQESSKTYHTFVINGEKHQGVYGTLKNNMYLLLHAPEREIKSTANGLRTTILGLMFGTLFLDLLVGIWMGRKIAQPIQKLIGVIDEIASLKLKENPILSANKKSKDETGHMAVSIEKMQSALRSIVGKIQRVEESIDQTTRELDQIMQSNTELSEDTSATVQELVSSMEETAGNTETIQEELTHTKERSNQIYDRIKQGTEAMEHILEKSVNLKTVTKESKEKTQTIYEELWKRSKDAVERSKAVEKINELTEEIRDISEQTNLLALNASIEAARAGEAGKGFAVVATEIGGLANQTFQTVDYINKIVEEVHAAVASLTTCTENMTAFLGETVLEDYRKFSIVGEDYEKEAKGVSDMMQHISSATYELNQSVAEISVSVDNINHAIEESNSALNSLAEKSGDTAESAKAGYESLQENREGIQTLHEVTKQFEL